MATDVNLLAKSHIGDGLNPSPWKEACAERDALAKDAARYRWLRSIWDDPKRLAIGGDWCFPADLLDTAIDNAMAGRVWGHEP